MNLTHFFILILDIQIFTMNKTSDSSRDLRRTRLILLLTLFCIGLIGCLLVLMWLIRYTRWNMRSARICSLILNLILADVSVNIFATGVQIYWEFQPNRQWPFNDFLCMKNTKENKDETSRFLFFFSFRSICKILSKFFYSFINLYYCCNGY